MSYQEKKSQQQNHTVNKHSIRSNNPNSQQFIDNRPEMQSAAQLYAAIQRETIANKPSYVQQSFNKTHQLSRKGNLKTPPYLSPVQLEKRNKQESDISLQMEQETLQRKPVQRFDVDNYLKTNQPSGNSNTIQRNETFNYTDKDDKVTSYEMENYTRSFGGDKNEIFDKISKKRKSVTEENPEKAKHTKKNNIVQSVKTETGLPTAYKILTDAGVNDANIKKGGLKNTKNFADRPHEIKVKLFDKPEAREESLPEVSPVGNLGDDETKIIDKKIPGNEGYHGGHLIGATIFGKIANETYNLAPQLNYLNHPIYFSGIENFIRKNQGQFGGSEITLHVKLKYKTSYYDKTISDLGHILNLKNLSAEIKKKKLKFPVRIPEMWFAEANLEGNKAKDKSISDYVDRQTKDINELKPYFTSTDVEGNLDTIGEGNSKYKDIQSLTFKNKKEDKDVDKVFHYAKQYTPNYNSGGEENNVNEGIDFKELDDLLKIEGLLNELKIPYTQKDDTIELSNGAFKPITDILEESTLDVSFNGFTFNGTSKKENKTRDSLIEDLKKTDESLKTNLTLFTNDTSLFGPINLFAKHFFTRERIIEKIDQLSSKLDFSLQKETILKNIDGMDIEEDLKVDIDTDNMFKNVSPIYKSVFTQGLNASQSKHKKNKFSARYKLSRKHAIRDDLKRVKHSKNLSNEFRASKKRNRDAFISATPISSTPLKVQKTKN